jgi:clan AA aspartic protease (TIGR02281 family)
VVAGIGTAWFTWNGYLGRDMGRPAVAPAIASGPPLVPAGKAAAVVPLPVVQAAPPASLANSQVVVPAPMPSVQRPTARSASVETASAISGPNEAVAERGSDGSFAFDAVVNGTHVRMLFDTGASVVGIRMEDALRLGIPVTKLNYSAKIKTANGTAEVAPVMIDTMLIGNITLRNIPGFVAKQGMLQENLLGQTFLARLAGFNVENNLLVLRGH